MTLREVALRLRAMLGRRKRDRDADMEMRFHVQMEVEAGMRRGMSEAESARAARLRLGFLAAARDAVRDERGFAWVNGLALDLRQAWVALRRRPAYLVVSSSRCCTACCCSHCPTPNPQPRCWPRNRRGR